MNGILDAKVKQKELVNKSDIYNLVKNHDLNKKLISLTNQSSTKGRARSNCET